MSISAKNNRGESMVSFMIALPCFLALCLLITLLMGGLLLRNLVLADTYSLARAHLYGNFRDSCTPSQNIFQGLRYLPPKFDIVYECQDSGLIKSEFKWGEQVLGRTRTHLIKGVGTEL